MKAWKADKFGTMGWTFWAYGRSSDTWALLEIEKVNFRYSIELGEFSKVSINTLAKAKLAKPAVEIIKLKLKEQGKIWFQ